MSLPVLAFVALAALLWSAVFGYLLALGLLARLRRRAAAPGGAALPPLTVVLPVRDEAALIDAKLADLAAADYPADRLRILVAEAGSHDDTAARAAAAAARHSRLTLLRVAGARHKGDQLRAALAAVDDEIVILTDADARLAPDCLRRLVEALAADPRTAVVGAWVHPASQLVEERLHWWLLNRLWWLEGEALGAAGVSGVCCAVRRSAVLPLPEGADDIALALAAGARGHRVRLCRAAHATELRVPQTAGELLRFRLRRGRHYVRALHAAPSARAGGLGWRLARAVRLFHFHVTPPAAAAAAGAALVLCWTPAWPVVLAIAAAFTLPLAAAGLAARRLAGSRRVGRGQRRQLGLAAARLAGLTWIAMLALPQRATRRAALVAAGAAGLMAWSATAASPGDTVSDVPAPIADRLESD